MTVPGVHTLMAEAYHADEVGHDGPSLSASIASILCTASPAHAKAAHPKLNPLFAPSEESKFDLGRASHSLFLEGEDIIEVIAADDWRQGWAKDARDEARTYGRVPLLAKHAEQARQMVAAIREQLDQVDVQPPLFTDGKPEQTLVWEEDGVLCRSRLDWLRDDHTAIHDLKTTSRSANPDTWTRTLYSIGADVQAAFYVRGLQAVTGRTVVDFAWCVVETFPPYALSVVSLPPAGWELANEKVDYALGVWKQCLATGIWPAYPTKVAYAEPPSWEHTRWLEKTYMEEAAA